MKRYGVDKDKEIQRLLQEMPEEGFRLLFDVYHMQLCVYVVQLTDSFQLAEDIVQDFFVAFWERKYYRAITGNFRSYLYTSVHNAALAALKKKKLVPMELLTGIPVEIPQESVLERDKKCVEAAFELGMSVNTLKTHLARALKKLRKDYHLSFLFYSF